MLNYHSRRTKNTECILNRTCAKQSNPEHVRDVLVFSPRTQRLICILNCARSPVCHVSFKSMGYANDQTSFVFHRANIMTIVPPVTSVSRA
nr:unnamed protein product [Callosobruchus analis]